MSSARMVSAEEPSRSRLDECFLTGLSSPPPTIVPLLSRSSYELTILWHAPHLSRMLTVLKNKDTSTCLLWMSLLPHISARPQLSDGRRWRTILPSLAGPHLHLLDTPTRRLGKWLQRCTLWLSSRSTRPRCSPVRKPVWMQLHSGT